MKQVILVTLVILVYLGSIAAADDHSEVAKAHYEQGQALYSQGRFAEARAEFLAGYDLGRKAAFLFNAAECSRLLDDKDAARENYTHYLKLEPSGKLATLARQRLAELGSATPPITEPIHSPPKPVVIAPPPRVDPKPVVVIPSPTITAARIDARSSGRPAQAASATPKAERIAGIVVAAGGIGLTLTGVYFAHRASTLSSQVSAACANGCNWQDFVAKDAEGKDDAHKQWVFFGVGTGAVATAAVLYWLGTRDHIGLALTPTTEGGAITWKTRW